MNTNFDPYREWLGIPKAEQPPNYYRLLGIPLMESDPSVVDRAADRVMLYLKTLSAGEYGQSAARLMSEVSLARADLLDPARKAAYDASLMAASASPPPLPAPKTELSPPPIGSTAIEPLIRRPRPLAARPIGANRKASQPQKLATSILTTVQIVFGGAGGLAIATLFVWISFGKDPLGLFNQSAATSIPKACKLSTAGRIGR